MLLMILRTLPGQNITGSADAYVITERAGVWFMSSHYLARRSFPSFEKLAHTLGGIVAWDRWSPDAQLQLDQLGVRGAF